MNKPTKSISINILSVFIILMCVLMGVVGTTNSWFTTEHKNGVQIKVDIGSLLLKVYQLDEQDNETEIFSDETNSGLAQESKPTQYVSLSGVISPNEDVSLKLKLSNDDKGAASMYVRFQFQIFRRGVDADSEILDVTIKGYDTPNASGNKFAKVNNYYYYQNSQGQNVKLEKQTSATMMTSFQIGFSGFVDEQGNLLSRSDSIYIKLTVDASASGWTI